MTSVSHDDLHRHARKLLTGKTVDVPDAFSGADIGQLRTLARQDPRLAKALDAAEDHQVTQYLAGVPLLLERYRDATPIVRAVIRAAMDARRLGCSPDLSYRLLEDAAPGYLLPIQRDAVSEKGWLDPVLKLTAALSNGIRGPVTPSRAKDGCYRLADYLEQVGIQERLDVLPPRDFWQAVRRHAAPGDLPALAQHAETRGLYRMGALLRMRALNSGEDLWVFRLLSRLQFLDPDGLPEAVEWIANRMDLSQPARVHTVIKRLQKAGRRDLAGPLAERAAHKADPTYVRGVDDLLQDLHRLGRGQALAALAARAAAQVDPADGDLILLYHTLRKTRSVDAVRTLVARDPFSGRDLTDNTTFWQLLGMLGGEGPGSPIMAAHAVRAAKSVELTQTSKVCSLLDTLAEYGFGDALAELLGRRPADQVDINDPDGVDHMMNTLSKAGALDTCQGLAERAAEHAALNATTGLALLRVLRPRAHTAADRLAERYASDARTNDPLMHNALTSLGHSGTPASVTALAKRLVDSVDPADVRAVAELLASLQQTGMDDLLRDLLGQVSLSRYVPTDPAEVTFLLRTLRTVGADHLVRELLALIPAASIDVSDEHVVVLLHLLEKLGDHEAAATLEARYADKHALTDPETLTWRYLNSDYAPAKCMRARLTPQNAEAVVLTDASAVADLIGGLRLFGADEALAVVLARLAEEPPGLTDADTVRSLLWRIPDTPEGRPTAERIADLAAEQVRFTDAFTLSHIINRYCELGCSRAIHILLARELARNVPLARWSSAKIRSSAPAGPLGNQEIHLDDRGVTTLIDALRQAGAQDQADLLATRAADAGMFAYWPEPPGTHFFGRDADVTLLSLLDHGLEPTGRYHYGRDLDGQPSVPWGWQDLLHDEERVGADHRV